MLFSMGALFDSTLQAMLRAQSDLSALALPPPIQPLAESSNTTPLEPPSTSRPATMQASTTILDRYRRSENSPEVLWATLDGSIFHGPDAPDSLRGLTRGEQLEAQRMAFEQLLADNPLRSSTALVAEHFSNLARDGRISEALSLARFFAQAGDARVGFFYGSLNLSELPSQAQTMLMNAQRTAFFELVEQGLFFRDITALIGRGDLENDLLRDRLNTYMGHVLTAVRSPDTETRRAGLESLRAMTSDSTAVGFIRNLLSEDTIDGLREALLNVAFVGHDDTHRVLATHALALCPDRQVSGRIISILSDNERPLGNRLAAMSYLRNLPDSGILFNSDLRTALENVATLPRGMLRAEAREFFAVQAFSYLAESRRYLRDRNRLEVAAELFEANMQESERCLRSALDNATALDGVMVDEVLGNNIFEILPALRDFPTSDGTISRAYDRGLWTALRSSEDDIERLALISRVVETQLESLNQGIFLSEEQLNTLQEHLGGLTFGEESKLEQRDRLLHQLNVIRTTTRFRELFESFFR